MEATLTNHSQSQRRRKKTTRGQKRHWTVSLAFAVVLGVILYQAVTTIATIFSIW